MNTSPSQIWESPPISSSGPSTCNMRLNVSPVQAFSVVSRPKPDNYLPAHPSRRVLNGHNHLKLFLLQRSDSKAEFSFPDRQYGKPHPAPRGKLSLAWSLISLATGEAYLITSLLTVAAHKPVVVSVTLILPLQNLPSHFQPTHPRKYFLQSQSS